MSMKQIKWGILGTSMISATMANAIQESAAGELYAVGSRSMTTATNFANQFGIPVCYDNFQKVLDDPEVNAVYIGLPNHLHKDWMIRCASAGKHILCEKPLVISTDEYAEAFAVVGNASVFCMEALMYRCHPLVARLCDIIRNKLIGDIKAFTAVYMADIAHLANPVAGGSIMNLGCYPVSLIRLLAGIDQGKSFAEPVMISATGRVNENNRDNQASVLLKFDNDVVAAVTTADDMGMYHQFEIYGTKGRISMLTNPWLPSENDNRFIIYQSDNNLTTEINVTAEKTLYTYQIDSVNDSISVNSRDCNQISGQYSLGNATVLEEWLRQVQKSN